MGFNMNIDEFFTRKDKDDNRLFCRNGNVELKLKNEDDRVRKIGKIYEGKKSHKIIYNKVVKQQNLYQTYNAWGINYDIFSNVDAVIIHVKNTEDAYQIKTAEVDKDFLHFKKVGFELQVFIHLDEWKNRNEVEKTPSV